MGVRLYSLENCSCCCCWGVHRANPHLLGIPELCKVFLSQLCGQLRRPLTGAYVLKHVLGVEPFTGMGVCAQNVP